MSNVIEFPSNALNLCGDDEARELMIGIFIDLCSYRDQESDQNKVSEINTIAKRLGEVLELSIR